MKRIHLLLLWTALYFSPQVHAVPINVPNGAFDCSCTTYAFCEPNNWTMINRSHTNLFCQTNSWMAGGGEVNGGDGLLLLGNGTTTYQDIPVSQQGEYTLRYREAEHIGASGTVYLEYLDSSKNVLQTVSNNFSQPFTYVTDGGDGQLSTTKTLAGGSSPVGTAYVRIKFYGTKGANGFAKVDDITLDYQAPPTPLTCNNEAIVNYVTSGTFSTRTQNIEKFNFADCSLVSDNPFN